MSEASASRAHLGSAILEDDVGEGIVPGADISALTGVFDYDSSLFDDHVLGLPGESLFPAPANDTTLE